MTSPPVGLTVFGCAPDEARRFHALAPGAGIAVTTTPAAADERTLTRLPTNRCVAVGHTNTVSRRELKALRDTGVEHLSTRSIGLDHIDLDAARELGIAVDNVVYSPDGVADFTVMLILMAIRHLPTVLSSMAHGDVRLGGARGSDLRDLTVGVLGIGHIGGAVVARLRGFGCRVLTHDPRRPETAGARHVSFDELLALSDVVTVHVPLTTATHHLIGRDELATMRRGAVLVNTARGALVDTDALVDSLEVGALGGVALDVIEGEDGVFSHDRTDDPVERTAFDRLQRLPNAVVTPHMAFHTARMLTETVEGTLRNCLDFERNRAHDENESRHHLRRVLGGA